jgi:4-hydroxybenzoate polyprenyltransferase
MPNTVSDASPEAALHLAPPAPPRLEAAPDDVPAGRPTLLGHFQIARVDHWVKNVFVLPGVVAALALTGADLSLGMLGRLALGLLAVGLVASSNYTINEVLDAPFDRIHPKKRFRPVPSGRVSIPLAYAQWVMLGVVGVAAGLPLGREFMWTMVALWVMGCVYNIRPLRSKDVPYVDVLTEAINNPIRMVAGWYIAVGAVGAVAPPATLLLAYWMVGCFFMGIKRYNEVRELGGTKALADYRKSLAYFTPERMLVAITFYGSTAMLFFGAFLMRYRVELVLAFPLVALVMARYLELGFSTGTAAQNPEKLYREPRLMLAVVACVAVMGLLMFADVPALHEIIDPSFLGGVRPATTR